MSILKYFFEEVFRVLINNYFGGVLFIFIGLYTIKFTIKNPQKYPDSPLQGDIKGWVGGISFVLIGISIIIHKFTQN